MAHHCTECGHELRDTDKFCAECGTPVDGAPPQAPVIQWQYCDIDLANDEGGGYGSFFFGGRRSFWRAIGVGPNGRFVAAKSGEFAHRGRSISDEASQALDELIRRLSRDGWELLPIRGSLWYNYKFRRIARG